MSDHTRVLRKMESVTTISTEELFQGKFNRRGYLRVLLEVFILLNYLKNSSTTHLITVGPKCGFLAVLCSFFSKVKIFHWFTGQVWSSRKKIVKISYWADKIIFILAHQTGCDSLSQKHFLSSNAKIFTLVPGLGSMESASPIGREEIEKKQEKIVKKNSLRVGFLGRLTKEKGIDFIYNLAIYTSKNYPDNKVTFLICGPHDEFGGISKAEIDKFNSCNNICLEVGFIDSSYFFSKIDVLIMPSSREGFCSTVLEAQSHGVPALVSNIYGLKESSLDGVTSLGFDVGDFEVASEYLDWFYNDKTVLSAFSYNAVQYSKKFSRERYDRSLSDIYRIFLSI